VTRGQRAAHAVAWPLLAIVLVALAALALSERARRLSVGPSPTSVDASPASAAPPIGHGGES